MNIGRLFVSLYLLGATCLINPLPTRLSPSDFSLFGIALGAIVTSGERRRIRLLPMASELGISERKIRQLLLLGMPHTQLQGVIWFEPSRVHAWLDKFNRTSRAPGIKRTRGMKLAQVTETEEDVGK
jgi:hypothetical protein